MSQFKKITTALSMSMLLGTLGCSQHDAIAASDYIYPGEPIPRAASTPTTAKNWAPPSYKIYAQTLVDEVIRNHPEVMSMTMHATPPGSPDGVYTMFAGSFHDRMGNASSPGDAITIYKAVTQVESKWGSANWKKKVSIVLPLKDYTGTYLKAAMVIAFRTSIDDPRIDTDFMAPGIVIRDSLNSKIRSFESLFAQAK
jgi:hypothetical protein